MARPEAGHDVGLETNGAVSARDAQLRADLEKIARKAEGTQGLVPAARTEVDPAVLSQQQATKAREVISQQSESAEPDEPFGIDALIDRVRNQNPDLVIEESGALNREQVMALAAQVRGEGEKDDLLAGLYRRGMFDERSLPDGSNELVAKDDNGQEALGVLNALERQLEDGRQANEDVAAARKADKEHRRETQRLMQANNGINDGDHKVDGSSVGWREDGDVVGKERARHQTGIITSISVPLSGATVPIGEARRGPDVVIPRAGAKPEAAEAPTPNPKIAEDPDAIMARMRDQMGLDEHGRPVTDRAREIHGNKDAAKAAAEAAATPPAPATEMVTPAAEVKTTAARPEVTGSRLHMTPYEVAEDKARSAEAATKAAKTAGSSGITDDEYRQAFEITEAAGVGTHSKSDLSPQELQEQIKNAKNAAELTQAYSSAVGAGHLNVDGGASMRGAEASSYVTSRAELAKELAEKLAKIPRTVEKARLEGQLAAGRKAMADAAREQIRDSGATEADKQRAWEAALQEDREALHQAEVAEQFNTMRAQVKGDVMLQRQIDKARDEATNTEKLRQQELTQTVGDRVATIMQRGYTREQGSSLVDRRTPNYDEIALMTREALRLEKAPFAERRTQGVVESDFWTHQPNMDNIMVRERRDARTGALLSQNIISLAGKLNIDKRGRVRLPEALEAADGQSLDHDIQARRDLGKPEHNLRGDLSRIYRDEYGASDTEIGLLRHEQQRQRGMLGRAAHRVRRRWRRFMG